MKKTYNVPTLEVVKMQASQQMLAGSPSVSMFNQNATGEGMSREMDFFGDGEF